MRLAFAQSGYALPFIESSFAPSTYLRTKRSRIYPHEGIGDTSATSIAAVAAQGAATTGGILAGLASMGAIAPYFALAGPIGAAVAGLTAVGIAIAGLFKGCGQTCIEATQIANQLQVYWQQNLDHYMQAPVHYKSLQLAALNNFDTGWNALYKACSDPTLGAAGQRCISERQRGGASSWCCNAPNAVQVGNGMCTGCDAFADYRDPIANDPNAVPDPVGSASGSGSGGTGTGLSVGGFSLPLPLLLIGGGVLVMTLMSD